MSNNNNNDKERVKDKNASFKNSDDEERKAECRNANNTRDRILVRDINAAFKELASLICNHMPDLEERNLTKLNTLAKAIELIPMLEKMVDGKNKKLSNTSMLDKQDEKSEEEY